VTFKGVILAGGFSRRFGMDKSMVTFDGQLMIIRAVALLKNLDLEPVIITRKSRRFDFLKCDVLTDSIANQGPLGGLYTACDAFPNHSLVVLTCDMPYLNQEALRILMNQHDRKHGITCYQTDSNQLQPFPGIYESDLAQSLFERIQTQQLSMQSYLAAQHAQILQSKLPATIFRNINYQDDLAGAL